MTVYCLYFSPCGSSRACAQAAAGGVSRDFVEVNLTNRTEEFPAAGKGDVLVVAAPVYSGRIPSPLAQKLQRARLDGAVSLALVVYGNRAYEDALIELTDLLAAAGAPSIAAGAFIARHVFVPEVAKDRPNAADLAQLKALGERTRQKLEAGDVAAVTVPGNRPYRAAPPAAAVPVVDASSCQKCGLCAFNCPTGAINPKNPHETDIALCIDCMRCINCCPEGARSLPEKMLALVTQKLSPLAAVTRENEFFC